MPCIGHTSVAGDRGTETTFRRIAEHFWWVDMKKDIQDFLRKCIHCISNKQSTIPRPFAEATHASHPNEVLHYDFLFISSKNKEVKYVLVLKDDLTNYLELVPAKIPNHFVV